MGGLVFYSKNSSNSFNNQVCPLKQSCYTNPMYGTHRLCIRTGTGADDIVRYGLTNDSHASGYCGFKLRMPNGSTAYIGMNSTYTSSQGRSSTITSSRASHYSTPHTITGTASSVSSSSYTYVTTYGTGGSFTVQGNSVQTYTYKPMDGGGVRVSSVTVTFPITTFSSATYTATGMSSTKGTVTYNTSGQSTHTATRSSQYSVSSSYSTRVTAVFNNINL